MSLSDDALVHKVQEGDRSAFDQLVEKYKIRAFLIARGMVGSPDDAKDLIQEAFVKAYEGIGGFSGKSSFFTWYCRILINQCIDHQRWKNRWYSRFLIHGNQVKGDIETAESIEGTAGKIRDPVQIIEGKELRSKIEEAVSELPPMQKAVFILRHYHHYSLREISNILHTAEGTVKTHLFRGIRSLQSKLKEFEPGR